MALYIRKKRDIKRIMENNNNNNQAASTTIICCVFLLFGMLFFSLIYIDCDFIFSGTFPIIIFLPIVFIGIFIPISAALRGNRQQQVFSYPSKVQQSQIAIPIKEENKNQNQPSKVEEIREYYCRYCGEKISQDSSYCPQCGTRLNY